MRVLVALAALAALTVIALVLVVNGPNRWILLSLASGAIAGCVFGATGMDILQPTPPPRLRTDKGDPQPPPWEQFLRELDRSRRYDLSFTLVRLPRNRARRGEELGRARRARREPTSDPGPVLRRYLRTTDVIWAEGGFVYVLLPGVERDQCERLLGRITARHPDLLGASRFACACFPHDGLTSNALLAALNDDSAGPATQEQSAQERLA